MIQYFIVIFMLLANETFTGKVCTAEIQNKDWRNQRRKMKRTGSWDDIKDAGAVFSKVGRKRRVVINEPDELTVQDLKRAGFRCVWSDL